MFYILSYKKVSFPHFTVENGGHTANIGHLSLILKARYPNSLRQKISPDRSFIIHQLIIYYPDLTIFFPAQKDTFVTSLHLFTD